MFKDFKHYHTAHCESGVLSSMFKNKGFDLSEAMLFGIGSAFFFIHVPFVKVYDIPLTAYRGMPGCIMKNSAKRLGFLMKFIKYRNPEKAMSDLDLFLCEHSMIGLQTSVYWLPYFPDRMRFHFNAHNIMVIGKKNEEYIISDPVLQNLVTCRSDDLKRARFGKGVFAPKGHLYYLEKNPDMNLIESAVIKGILQTCRWMLYIPLPFTGVKGIRYLAASLLKWPGKLNDPKKLKNYIGNIIRMQEEIGTGGAGFRYMYASFLQESSIYLNNSKFQEFSEEMTEIGDRWREFALQCAYICKGKEKLEAVGELSKHLTDISLLEEKFFRNLFKFIRQGTVLKIR